MELFSFVGRMSALKNELLSILPKSIDAKTLLVQHGSNLYDSHSY